MGQIDSCQRGGALGGWMKEVEGIKKIYTHITHHIDTNNSGNSQRERGRVLSGGGQRRGKWGRKETLLGRWVHDAVCG